MDKNLFKNISNDSPEKNKQKGKGGTIWKILSTDGRPGNE